MKRTAFALPLVLTGFVGLGVLLSPHYVGAVGCGDIVYPVGYYYEGSAEDRSPIDTCDNPFGRTGDLVGLRVMGVEIVPDSVISSAEPTITDYGFTGEGYFSQVPSARYYRHDGNDLVAIDTSFNPPTTAENKRLISEYFAGNEIRRAFYEEVYLAENPFSYFYDENGQVLHDQATGERIDVVYNALSGYIEQHATTIRKPLSYGTYTAVLMVGGGFQSTMNETMPWYTHIVSYFIPVAYADTDIQTVTFTIAPPKATGASSVLFLPGIQASHLYRDGLVGTEDQIWEPDGNQDVRQLVMDTSGVSTNRVYTRDIAGKVYYGYTSIYNGFSTYMDTLVASGTIKEWTPFAYDWRYSVDDIAQNGTQYQNEIRSAVDEVIRLASSSLSGKVTIIGHSNGGLLAKAVMMRLAVLHKSDLVDRVVFLASPQLGTPKAIAGLLHGYDQEIAWGYLVDDAVARDITKNMPGAYGLVPSSQYFNTVSSTFIKFDASTSTAAFRRAYGEAIDSPAELSAFMTGATDGRTDATTIDEAMKVSSSLLQKEQNMHNALDTWVAPSDVKVVEVVGTGLDTVAGFEYRTFTERVCTLFVICRNVTTYKPVPLMSSFGDKTVVAQSAAGYLGEKDQYFIDLEASDVAGGLFSSEHYNITENPSIQKLINNILLQTTSTIDFITTAPQSSADNRILMGAHSPVTLEVTDIQGRRAGRGSFNGHPVPMTDIPGSSYFELGGSSYIIVPDTASYKVTMKGTGQGGLTFTLDSLKGSLQIPLVSVRVATITPSTTVSVAYTTSTLSNISIDQNSDGIADQVLTPQGVDVTPVVAYKTLRNSIEKLTLTQVRKGALLLLVGAAEALDKNPKLTALEKLTLNQLEVVLLTYQKNKLITKSDLTTLTAIISRLK